MANFPVPVGGIVYPSDFIPSLVFLGLYALLLPLTCYRIFNRRSRTILLASSSFGTVERIVVFIIRTIQSRNETPRFQVGLVKYTQVTLAMGYLGLLHDVIALLRCALVNPTYSSAMYYQSPDAQNKEGFYSEPAADVPDRTQLRSRCRKMMGALQMQLLIGGFALAAYGNSLYSQDLDDQRKSDITAVLRTVSSVVGLVVSVSLIVITGWSVSMFRRINTKRSAGFIAAAAGLMLLVAVYRLNVMGHRTTSLEALMEINKSKEKVEFYIFYIPPEWLFALMFLTVDIRKTFGTGPMGDTRRVDMTPEEHEKWVVKQAKKKQRSKAKLGFSMSNGTESAIPLQQNIGSGGGGHPYQML